MKNIVVKLNEVKRGLVAINDRNEKKLKDISSGGKRGAWVKLYAGKIAASSILMLAGLVNILSAGLSITLSGGNWDLGTQPSGSAFQTSGSQWTVTGASDGSEDVDIRVNNSGSWSPSGDGNAGAVNQFGLRITNSGGTPITNSDTRLNSNLQRNANFTFGLWFKTPPLGSEAGSHSLTVTLTAKNFVQWCSGGWNYGGWCWRPSPSHDSHHWFSCDYVCYNYHGKGYCDYSGIAHYMYTHHGGAAAVVCHYANHHHCYFHYGSHCHMSMAYCYHWHNWGITYSRSSGHHEQCAHGGGGYQCWTRRMCSCTM